MKIVHIVRDNYTPLALNGVYKVIDNISKALSDGGANITVCSVAPHVSNEIYHSSHYNHIQFREHPLRFFLDKSFKAFLLSCPKDTVFHFHSVFIPWFLPAVRLLKKHGYKRVVLTPHGQYINQAMECSLKKKIFFYFFDRKVLKTVDAVQIIGATEENRYITENAKDFYLIPNGCLPSEVEVNEKTRLIFGYMGRLEISQKGLDILLQAFAFYKKQGGLGILKLAGAGPDKLDLEHLCLKIGLKDSVIFAGKIIGNEKCDFLKSCSYFLHSSRWDVLPTGCLEAASCGIPLIVSEETNLKAYIESFKSGFVYPSDGRPVQALADSLFKAEHLFMQKGNYIKCCENAKKMISEELNWYRIVKMDSELLYKS